MIGQRCAWDCRCPECLRANAGNPREARIIETAHCTRCGHTHVAHCTRCGLTHAIIGDDDCARSKNTIEI